MAALLLVTTTFAAADITRPLVLAPSGGNPRNSEGDFIALRDGTLLFIYTHFTGGTSDHASAHLAARTSTDGGVTWSTQDQVIVPNAGDMNIMSVSLLRLADGRIALFHLRKDSLSDCRPVVRYSSDEAKTWTDPLDCVTDEVGYYVMNNDRAIQLRTGRIVLPLALHKGDKGQFVGRGRAMCYLSDDGGKTFRRSQTVLDMTDAPDDRTGLQEPGVVELRDGRLMMFIRTDRGSQYLSFSSDGGETWSPAEPSDLHSPRSPASIERLPGGDLLAVWNDHRDPASKHRNRTPLSAAISRDDGRTWEKSRTIEADPQGWYCYTAIEFVGDHALLGHCAGIQTKGATGLATTQITSVPISWLMAADQRK